MKITKQQLRQLIHEETQDVLKEFEPKRSDQNLSPAELAQRKAKQAQMKTAHGKKAAKLGDTRRPKRQRQDPPVSNYRSGETPPTRSAPGSQASTTALANREDIEMYDAPVQGAETDRDIDRDIARLGIPVGPDLRKAALDTRPGPSHEPPDEGNVGATINALGAGQKEIDKFKRAKRTRQFEAKITKQQLQQLVKEEFHALLEEKSGHLSNGYKWCPAGTACPPQTTKTNWWKP